MEKTRLIPEMESTLGCSWSRRSLLKALTTSAAVTAAGKVSAVASEFEGSNLSLANDASASVSSAKSLRAFVVSDAIPAKNWMDAFPVGNGRLGAMLFGDYPDERILINDNTVWLGRSEVCNPPADAARVIKEVREALFKDDFKISESLLNTKVLAPRPEHMD